jgi:subtilisin family serine protease
MDENVSQRGVLRAASAGLLGTAAVGTAEGAVATDLEGTVQANVGYEDRSALGRTRWGRRGGPRVRLRRGDTTTLREACAYADERGVLLVVAAGNDGPCTGCLDAPARDSSTSPRRWATGPATTCRPAAGRPRPT